MASMTPHDLVAKLRDALGNSLGAAVLYGSAVAGEHFAGRSDYNVLVIVDKLPAGSLRVVGAATRKWVAAGNPPPLIFTMEEWRRSADVFPMEYSDILDRHDILFGDDLLQGISVAPADLRLQVEREARGKLLHLRSAMIAASNDQNVHLAILESTLSGLMILYRAVLRLHGERPPTDYETLTQATARLGGFDAEAVLPVVRHVRGAARLSKERAPLATAAYLVSFEQLVGHLDTFRGDEP